MLVPAKLKIEKNRSDVNTGQGNSFLNDSSKSFAVFYSL